MFLAKVGAKRKLDSASLVSCRDTYQVSEAAFLTICYCVSGTELSCATLAHLGEQGQQMQAEYSVRY